jgi:hypothetical protein
MKTSTGYELRDEKGLTFIVHVKRSLRSETYPYTAFFSMFDAYGKTPKEAVQSLLSKTRKCVTDSELRRVGLV